MRFLLSLFMLLAVSATAANYVPNSSFECGIGRGWLNYGTANSAYYGNAFETKSLLTNDAHTGSFALIAKGVTQSRAFYMLAGTKTYSMWAKSSTPGAGPFYFGIIPAWLLKDGTIAGTTNVAGTWTRYTLTYVAPSNGFYHVKFNTEQSAINFMVDDIQVEDGASATTYAPESTIEMAMSSAATNRTWFRGQVPTFDMNFWNHSSAVATLVEYKVFNAYNSNVFTALISPSLAAATNSVVSYSLFLPYGHYRIKSRITTIDDSEDEIAIVFHSYPSNTTAGAIGWLGGHSHGSLFHAGQEKRALREISRTLSPNYGNTRHWDTQTGGLEPTRGATYGFDDAAITNLTYNGIRVIACLTPEDGKWAPWATNILGYWDRPVWSNYTRQVVTHLVALGVTNFEFGPNEPLQSGPAGTLAGWTDQQTNDSLAGLLYTSTNKPVQSRVATNYSILLAVGISGASNACQTCNFIAIGGANLDGSWALDVWNDLISGNGGIWASSTNWITSISTHQYPADNSSDPNDPVYEGTLANTLQPWLDKFRPKGLKVLNTEAGTYYGLSSFKGMNGQYEVAFETETAFTYPEAYRGEWQQRTANALVREPTEALRTIGKGYHAYIKYDCRYQNNSSFDMALKVNPYAADFTGVDHPHMVALSEAASLVCAPGFGPATNTSYPNFIEAYVLTNALGNPVVPLWSNARTNYTMTFPTNDFEVLDEFGNQVQTNGANFAITRFPRYLRSGTMTVVQMSNYVRTATVAVLADTTPPQVSIDLAPSGLWDGRTNKTLVKWSALDDRWTAWASNTVTHTTNSSTYVAYKWKLDGASYNNYNPSNHVWIPNLAAGNHTFYVTAIDNAGNSQEVSYEFAPATNFISVIWPMDEGSGTTITSSVPSAMIGTLVNGVTWGQGVSGRGLSFDGVDDYVSFGSITNIPDSQSFSMSVFIKTLDHNRRQEIYWEGAERTFFSLNLTGDNLLAVNSRADAQIEAQSTVPVPMGNWAHVAITFTNLGTNRLIKFYINGNLTDTVSTDGELFLNNGPAFLGAGAILDSTNAYHLARFFMGELDSLRFYSSTLSAAQVAALATENIRGDVLAPARFNLKPYGVQQAMLAVTPISLNTDESCACRYSLSAGVAYTDMSITFTSRFGNTIHESVVYGVTNGQTFTAYVRCLDTNGNADVDDRVLSFSVTNSQAAPITGYFMATNGSDANPGTLALPWATFIKAGATMVAGDTLYVRAGTYNQRINDGANGGTDLTTGAIAYRNYPGERPLIIPTTNNNVVRFQSRSNIVIDGFILDASRLTVTDISVCKVTDTAHHVRFTNCEIRFSLNSHGVQSSSDFARGDGVELLGCVVHDNGNIATLGPRPPNHGYYLSSSNCIIEDNLFYHNSAWQIHGYSGISDNTIVRRNIMYDSLDGGILCSNGTNWLIANNLIINPSKGTGIDVRGYQYITGIKILNNTIRSCPFGILLSDSGNGVFGTRIANNIVYECFNGGVIVSAAATNSVVHNNLIAKSPTVSGSSYSDLGVNTTSSSNLVDATYDPLFANPYERNFHILTNSSAFNVGTNLVEVTQDFDLHTRPQFGTYDIGFSEFGIVSGARDNWPPSTPANLSSSITSFGRIALTWSASSDDVSVVGYRIYRSHVPVADVISATYADLGVPTIGTLNYSVSAFDARGNFSPFSSQVTVIIGGTLNVSGVVNVGTITIVP